MDGDGHAQLELVTLNNFAILLKYATSWGVSTFMMSLTRNFYDFYAGGSKQCCLFVPNSNNKHGSSILMC